MGIGGKIDKLGVHWSGSGQRMVRARTFLLTAFSVTKVVDTAWLVGGLLLSWGEVVLHRVFPHPPLWNQQSLELTAGYLHMYILSCTSPARERASPSRLRLRLPHHGFCPPLSAAIIIRAALKSSDVGGIALSLCPPALRSPRRLQREAGITPAPRHLGGVSREQAFENRARRARCRTRHGVTYYERTHRRHYMASQAPWLFSGTLRLGGLGVVL